MSEPTQPDGQPPARPPRSDGRPADSDQGADPLQPSDPTPERAERPQDPDTTERPGAGSPPQDPTVGFPAVGAANPSAPPPAAQPPGQYPPAQPPGGYPPAAQQTPGHYPPGQYPPGQYPPTPQQPGGASGPPPGAYVPTGPGYGGPPPGGVPPYGVSDGSDSPEKKSGLLVAGLIALVVALVGALGFVVLQGDDDETADPVTTDASDDDVEVTVESTEPETTPPPTEVTTTVPEVVADGSVDGVFVHIESFPEVLAEEDLDSTLQGLGLTDGNNPVSSADPVLNLCAAVPVEAPVSATVTWLLDNVALSESAERVFATPADGNCINNAGDPLASGAYEVSFTDVDGSMSGVALYTIGAATVTQEFLNDTDGDLCAVELAPTAAGFFQSFEVNGGDALVPGDSILIDIADVEHEVRGLDCDEVPLDSFFASPGADPVGLASGTAVVATTTTTAPPPPPQITDGELNEVSGAMGSLDLVVESGSAEEQAVIDLLTDPESGLRIATEEQSLTLCGAWVLPGRFDGEIVWEFNRAVIARFPVSTDGGSIGNCIPPGGAAFAEGAYQVYLERGDNLSLIETFTVGRAETQLAFINDTGVPVCRVGFSPNLTNWYTFYEFADSTDFEESVEPGDGFTIVAPFIENDIRAFDCDGDQVSEALNIPPTDQTLDLSTGT